MKQSSKTTILKFKTMILINEKTDETNRMYDTKIKIFVTQKFLLSNKTQIEKFNYFSTNSIAVDASNKKNSHLKVY